MRPLTKVPNADINEPGDRATAAKLADGEMSPLCMKNDESHLYTAPLKHVNTNVPVFMSSCEQGNKPTTLPANNKHSGGIGTLPAISSDCHHRGPVRLQR